MYRRAVVEKFAISCRKPIWVCGRTRLGDTLKCIIENVTYTTGALNEERLETSCNELDIFQD